MCVCASISPGMTVNRDRSITCAPAGAAPLPIDTMRSFSTTITAFGIVLPEPSTTFAARIAFVAADAGAGTSARTQHNANPEPRRHEDNRRSHARFLVQTALRVLRSFRVFVIAAALVLIHTSLLPS